MLPRRLVVVVAVVGAVTWSWFASGVRTFTHPAEVLTFIPGVVVLVITLLPTSRLPEAAKPRQGGRGFRRFLPWLALIAAVVGWELFQLFSQPRSEHPTLSSMLNTVLSTHPTRFLGYLGWLALGWLLVRDLRARRAAVVARRE